MKHVSREDDQSPEWVRLSQPKRLSQSSKRRKRAEALRAASELVSIGIEAADRLEFLSEQLPDLLKEVAADFAVLPFNLGLSRPRKGGKRGLLRAKVAKAHLTKLDLGVAHHPVAEYSQVITGKRSVYRVAAEQLHNSLLSIRAYPGNYISRRGAPTDKSTMSGQGAPTDTSTNRWMKELSALEAPMTGGEKGNWRKWWEVGRVLLCDQWDRNRPSFSVLIKESGLEEFLVPPTNKPSKVKSRIIDQMVRKEFILLAI